MTCSEIETKNILLLGETGVGKSTWINAAANYVTNHTISEATSPRNFKCLIPAKVTMTDINFEEYSLTVGEFSSAETLSDKGQSATQYPKAYFFSAEDMNIRLIDTPGINDSRGRELDKQNCENILMFLNNSNIKQLHGICILLKPYQSRLTDSFRYCVEELLRQLHKSAAANIIFCFTHARAVDFEGGDTVCVLKELIREIECLQGVKIPFGKNNTFYLDNESFNYICTVKNGLESSRRKKKYCEQSWEQSREETIRLFKYISTIQPYNTRVSFSINEARHLIKMLVQPMIELQITLNEITEEMEYEIKRILAMGGVRKGKTLKFTLQQKRIKVIELPEPHLECRSCTETFADSKTKEVKTERKVCKETPGVEMTILRLLTFPYWCNACGCSLFNHIETNYKTVTESYTETIESIEKLNEKISEMKIISKRVTEIAAYFMQFISKNSLASCDDEVLANIAQQEKLLNAQLISNKDNKNYEALLESLKQLKNDYTIQKEQIESRPGNIFQYYRNTEKVFAHRDELYGMKYIGTQLEQMINASVSARAKVLTREEVVVSIKNLTIK